MKGIAHNKGRYVDMDVSNPTGLGVCDRTGFVFNHNNLIEQKEWRGNRLMGTGVFVGKPFLDVPQEQNRPPKVKDDPRPLKNPRPMNPYVDPTQPSALPPAQLLAKLLQVQFMS